ncbi:SusC/RagA family TonB-linked outer membrane protein [Ekhidna sp.]
MKYLKFGFSFIVLILIVGYAQAQRAITGKVTDAQSGEALIGATVQIKGTTNGAITDLDGNYTLSISDGDILVASYLGFNTREIDPGNRTVVDFQLEVDLDELQEVIVVGYGTTTAKELTGAATKVAAEEITKRNVPRLDQALQGQTAGVNITTNSGAPGGTSNIRIRGISTNGNSNPLILVDGVKYDPSGLNALNPSDIESVNVLKDATAAIYGVQAANGVILIETKKGRLNSKPSIEFNGYYGIQEAARKLDVLNATEYAILKNEAFVAGGQTPLFDNTSLGEGTDWQDEVFQTAPIQNYNISVSGGTDKTTYNIGGSYFGQEGIAGGGDKANFERINGRINFTTELAPKVKLTSVLLYTNELSKTVPVGGIGSILYSANNAPPTSPVRVAEENNRFSYLTEVADIVNPLALIENTFNESRVNKFTGKEEISYEINDNLTITGRGGYNYALVEGKSFFPLVWYGPGKPQSTAANEDLDPILVDIGGIQVERGAEVQEFRNTFLDYNFEGFLNYNRAFGSHAVKGTLGASLFGTSSDELRGFALNIPNNDPNLADISTNQATGNFLNNTTSYQVESKLVSTFVRAEYDFEKRYFLSVIVRRDGSTRFGANNKFGIFPAVSAGWVISDESFFTPSFIDFAKVRVSYGVVGNDQIGDFAYRALLGGEGDYVFNDAILRGVAIGRAGNPDLKWERNKQLNIGIDLDLIQSFSLTANYFVKNTNDLLFAPDVLSVLGTYGPGSFPPIINGGNIRNSGVELDLGYDKQLSNGLNISISSNFTLINNEVTKVPNGLDFVSGTGFGIGGGVATRLEEGFPIGYFVGYKTDGIWQTQEEINASTVDPLGVNPPSPGDLRFVDVTGDNIVDENDRTQIGSPIPDFTIGFNLNLDYKGIDLTANIWGAFGQDIIRNYERAQPLANQLSYTLNRWTGPGSTNEYPRLTTGLTQNNVFSDFYVEDGSFVRLRNIQVGYTLPTNLSSYLGATSIRFYVGGTNLLTFTKYLGYDPDVGGGAYDPDTQSSPLDLGVDNGRYPQARVLMGGFNIKF